MADTSEEKVSRMESDSFQSDSAGKRLCLVFVLPGEPIHHRANLLSRER
jgi:hypothetical protein